MWGCNKKTTTKWLPTAGVSHLTSMDFFFGASPLTFGPPAGNFKTAWYCKNNSNFVSTKILPYFLFLIMPSPHAKSLHQTPSQLRQPKRLAGWLQNIIPFSWMNILTHNSCWGYNEEALRVDSNRGSWWRFLRSLYVEKRCIVSLKNMLQTTPYGNIKV